MTKFAAHLLLPALALLASAGGVHAQYRQQDLGTLAKPAELYKADEIGVDEKLGAVVPTATLFVDEDGRKVALADYLGKGRPVILWLGYYECPMLCDQMSRGMVDATRQIRLDAGREFAIVNVSIDPNESASLARSKKATYLKEFGQPGNAAAWNLLTGSPESVAALAGSVGYKFKKVTVKDETQYAHPAVLIVLSPEGKIARYLYPKATAGVAFDADTMRLSLIEASDGRVGSTLDRLLLTCLQYDAHAGRYTKDAIAIMKWAGAATVVVMGAVFVPLWVRAARGRDRPGDDVPPGALPA